jgi:hypothetical protein
LATTERTAAKPSAIAVYPDDGGMGSVLEETATATARHDCTSGVGNAHVVWLKSLIQG